MAEFYYHKVLTGLKNFYKSMQIQGIDVGTFCFEYNNVTADVIFNTLCLPWKLIFIKRNEGKILEIEIKRGYVFSIETSLKFKEVRLFFNISGVKGSFSINAFQKSLDNSIPFKYELTDKGRETILNYDKMDNKQPGIYPIGVINWALKHAMHPEWPPDKFHRTNENLMKTKQLYPSLYKATNHLDITIKYGNKPFKTTEKLKDGYLLDSE